MPFRFEKKKAFQVILFLLHSLGGTVDISRLFLFLYLADLSHLGKYGSLILGDSYIAMKYGPVPYTVLETIRQLQEEPDEKNSKPKTKVYFSINENDQAVAMINYDSSQLSASEVECMYEVVRKYKNMDTAILRHTAIGKAWQGANGNGEISITDMAAESGATPEMIAYIAASYKNEVHSFKYKVR